MRKNMMANSILIGIYLSARLQGILKEYGIISVLALAAGYVTALPVAVGYAGPLFPNYKIRENYTPPRQNTRKRLPYRYWHPK